MGSTPHKQRGWVGENQLRQQQKDSELLQCSVPRYTKDIPYINGEEKQE